MNIKITADSTCDLPVSLLQRYQISLLPLYVNLGGRCLRDTIDVTPDDIYAHVAGGGDMCSTSAGNISDYLDLFTPLAAQYDAVIHISLGAGFSSSYQNACLAAQDFTNVYVLDSRNLCAGSGHMAVHGAELAAAGWDAAAIVEALQLYAEKLDSSFILSQLEYLKKGGRCSSLVAMGANLLHLKPCIDVTGGIMKVGKKYRGTFEKCMEQYIRDRLSDPAHIDTSRIFIAHSGLDAAAVESAQRLVAECADFGEIITLRAGCTISSHCGPGTFGLLIVHK